MYERNRHHSQANMYLNVNIIILIIVMFHCLMTCTLKSDGKKRRRKSSKPKNATRRAPPDCHVSVPINSDGYNMPMPMVISGYGKPVMKYPDENGNFTILHMNDLILSCSGSNFTSPPEIYRESIVIKCKRGSFDYKRKKYQFEQFKCERNPAPTLVFSEEIWKAHTNRIIEVGFDNSFEFQILYKMSYEMNFKNTLFAWYFVNPSLTRFRQKSVFKPEFVSPYYCNDYESPEDKRKRLRARNETNPETLQHPAIDVMKVYQNQTNVLAEILKSKEKAEFFIKKDKKKRLYLAPDLFFSPIDFVYSFQHNATYYYENSIPQWLYFSEDIWTDVEELFLRNLGGGSNSTHLIITGWFLTSTFPDTSNKERQFYLYSPKRMPVPQFRWKMDYDMANKTGIVYVAMCDAYTPLDKVALICEPMDCPNFDQVKEATKKMVYCCSKKSFDEVYYLDVVNFEEF